MRDLIKRVLNEFVDNQSVKFSVIGKFIGDLNEQLDKKKKGEAWFKLKNYINELKQNSKCSKCGDKRWYVLDFHHLNDSDKEYNISYLVKQGANKKIKEELKKCVILCSNCHRELHHFEREEGSVAQLVER